MAKHRPFHLPEPLLESAFNSLQSCAPLHSEGRKLDMILKCKKKNANPFTIFGKGSRHHSFLLLSRQTTVFSWLKPSERRAYFVLSFPCRKYSTTSRVPFEGSVCNCACCLSKPNLSLAYRVFFFPVQSSPSLYQGTLISRYLLCVGRGCFSTNWGQRFDENWAHLLVTLPR